jgi:hypothetical protein
MIVDLQFRVVLDRKNALQYEAKIYFNTYTEVTDYVKHFATQNGVTLVLQFNGEDIKAGETNPQILMKSLNKPVLYHYSGIDITPIILEALNKNWKDVPKAASSSSKFGPTQR